MSKSITGCCPPFNPSDWDGQTFTFDHKMFLKFTTRSIFHIPLNMNKVMEDITSKVEQAGAATPDHFMLSVEESPWRAEHYLAVKKEVPNTETVRISGSYLARVFEGPYKDMRKWHDVLIKYAKSQGKHPVNTFFSYVLCPNCAKAYGHNYVVGFEQVV